MQSRCLAAVCGALICCAAPPPADCFEPPVIEAAFPFTARVVDAQAPVHCGPGADYYETTRLARGAEVEVYRRDAGGWLAIRPPQSAFSLVAARYLEFTGDPDLAVVNDRHAVAWVGAERTEVDEHKWQVRLEPGEQVVVTGEETRRTYPGGPLERHYRIAPPAGEFRWIRESSVRHPSQPPPEPPSPEVRLTDFRVVIDQPEAAPQDGFVARQKTTEHTTPVDDRPSAADPTVRPAPADGQRSGPLTTAGTVLRDASPPPREPLEAREFVERLEEADIELSLAVARSPLEWRLESLRQEADTLVARGPTTVDRARAERLAEKIAEFQQLQERYAAASTGRASGAGPTAASFARDSGSLPDTAEQATGSGLAGPLAVGSELDPRFDGSGWLLPVHSNKPGAPPYALLDNQGNIRQFVSPAPGLNLHRYLRKEIGIFGQRGERRNLDKPHLTAHRIVDLKRHR